MTIGKRAGPGRPKKVHKKPAPETLAGVPVQLISSKAKISLKPQTTQLAAQGKVSEIEKLIDEGVEVDSLSPNGSSALVLAAKYGHLQAVNLLVQNGAQTYKEALIAARQAGHAEVAAYLASIMRA